MSCLDQLPLCEAACCKSFTINMPPGFDKLKRFKDFAIRMDLDPDQQWYYYLHGVKLVDDFIVLKKAGYTRVGPNRIMFHRRCQKLTKDNRCSGHPDNKPQACKDFTQETAYSEKYVLPPNCRFRRKKE